MTLEAAEILGRLPAAFPIPGDRAAGAMTQLLAVLKYEDFWLGLDPTTNKRTQDGNKGGMERTLRTQK